MMYRWQDRKLLWFDHFLWGGRRLCSQPRMPTGWCRLCQFSRPAPMPKSKQLPAQL